VLTDRFRTYLPAVPLAAVAAWIVLEGEYIPAHQPAAFGIAVAVVGASAAAIVAMLAVLRPWWGLLAWFGMMPFVNPARAQVWFGPIQFIPSTPILLALIVGVGVAWRRGQLEGGALSAPSRRVGWWGLGMAALLVLASTLVAPWTTEGLNVTVHGALEPIVLAGLVLVIRPGPGRALGAMAVLGASVVVGAVINLVYLFVRLWPMDLYSRRILFARLTYFNVGIFANLLVISLSMLAAILLLRRRLGWPSWVSTAAWIAIGIVLLALFFTYTKSAWLSAAAVAALLTLTMVTGWWRRAALLVATAGLLAVVVPYPYPVLHVVAPGIADSYQGFVVQLQGQQRVQSWDPETQEGSGSVAIRWVALGAAAEMVREHPLLGLGPTQFGPAFRQLVPNSSVPALSSAHDLLAEVASEYGLPLAVLLGLTLAVAILRGVAALREPDSTRRVVLGCLAIAILGFVVMATLFGVDLYRSPRTMNTDVLAAALLVALALSAARPQPDSAGA
jgi:O-Antigen ligase